MKTLLLGIAVALLAGCATRGDSAGSPPPRPSDAGVVDDDPRFARIEARLIGLTDELDRLSRRVGRLEAAGAGPGAAEESAETMPEAEPESGPAMAGPGPDAPPPPEDLESPEPPPMDAPGPTGILVDLRALGDRVPAGRSFAIFRLVDPAGEVLVSSSDIPGDIRNARPVFWQASPTAVLGPAQIPPIGAAPWIATVVSLTIEETEEGVERAVLVLGKKSAEAARATGNLRELAAAGHLVIVVREGE